MGNVMNSPSEFERILVHEIFHFVWVRLSNSTRRSWERVLASEFSQKIPGELGWSAEWRKQKLQKSDRHRRTPAWRRYACESFCDSAAWLFAGLQNHDEFTLSPSVRRRRRAWLVRNFPATATISI